MNKDDTLKDERCEYIFRHNLYAFGPLNLSTYYVTKKLTTRETYASSHTLANDSFIISHNSILSTLFFALNHKFIQGYFRLESDGREIG